MLRQAGGQPLFVDGPHEEGVLSAEEEAIAVEILRIRGIVRVGNRIRGDGEDAVVSPDVPPAVAEPGQTRVDVLVDDQRTGDFVVGDQELIAVHMTVGVVAVPVEVHAVIGVGFALDGSAREVDHRGLVG